MLKSEGRREQDGEETPPLSAGVEFEDDGEKWRVLKVVFDAEHEDMVCFYYDASIDAATAGIDDCEYSSVEEVTDWVRADKRRKRAAAARARQGLGPEAKSAPRAPVALAAPSPGHRVKDDAAFAASVLDDDDDDAYSRPELKSRL